jgi:copper(I)-binding protein
MISAYQSTRGSTTMKRFFLSALCVTIWAGAALADTAISIGDPYVRLAPPSAENTGMFMVIRNRGDADIKLIGAASPAAKSVELHTVIEEGGMNKMRPVPSIPVKAKGETALKPGDYHVMLIGLNKPLNEGDIVPLTLKFDDGSSQSLQVPVRRIHMPMSGPAAMPMN